jgi:hypothetical protein
VKIVIFLCDRYEAQRSRAADGKCGLDRLGEPFTNSFVGATFTTPGVGATFTTPVLGVYGDSEVLVEEHNEGYCAQQWNRGDVGMRKGCLHRAGGMWGKVVSA